MAVQPAHFVKQSDLDAPRAAVSALGVAQEAADELLEAVEADVTAAQAAGTNLAPWEQTKASWDASPVAQACSGEVATSATGGWWSLLLRSLGVSPGGARFARSRAQSTSKDAYGPPVGVELVVKDIAHDAGGWVVEDDGTWRPSPPTATAHGWGAVYRSGSLAVFADEGELWLQLPHRRLAASEIRSVQLEREQVRRSRYRVLLRDGSEEVVLVRFPARVAVQRALDPLYDEIVSLGTTS